MERVTYASMEELERMNEYRSAKRQTTFAKIVRGRNIGTGRDKKGG